jgi:hypothetical protein
MHILTFSLLSLLILTLVASVPSSNDNDANYVSLMKRTPSERISIYTRSPPSTRSQFWIDKLKAYTTVALRRAHGHTARRPHAGTRHLRVREPDLKCGV